MDTKELDCKNCNHYQYCNGHVLLGEECAQIGRELTFCSNHSSLNQRYNWYCLGDYD